MKTLILVRHANAVENYRWDDILDFYRKLTTEGKKESKEVVKDLLELNIIPSKIVSSSSKRTYQTTLIIWKWLEINSKDIVFTNDLYMSSKEAYLDWIYATDDKTDKLMIVWHNPGISHLSDHLNQDKTLFHTGQMMIIRYDTDKWFEIAAINQIA